MLSSPVAVQGGQAQVARLGVGDGRRHGFAVANFANQNNVGRLAQGVFQGDLHGLGIGADFALINDGFFVVKLKFDRVFNRQDVAAHAFAAPVDHGCQRGAFAGAGGADDQQQAALLQNQVAQNFWQLQRCQTGHVLRNKANDHGDGAALVHGTDTKPPHALQGYADVELARFLQGFHIARRDDLGQQRARAIDRQQLAIDGNAFAVDFDEDGGVDCQVNVRSFFIGH